MDSLILTGPTRTVEGDSTLASCYVTIPGKARQELWFRTSGRSVVDSSDSFVAVSLMAAMAMGVPLVSEGPVSRTLLETGLPAVQRVYAVWRDDTWRDDLWSQSHPEPRRFRTVAIDAPVVDDMPAAPGGVGLFFSSGVDSSFSLVEARDEVTDLIFLHDFEGSFPPEQRSRTVAGVAEVARAFGKNIITVETNAKALFYPEHVSWPHLHGALLAAIALQLQGRIAKVHFPATFDVRRLQPWGSHPYLDPLWSTRALRMVHDRLDVTRLDKLAVVARESVLLKNLRVCGLPHHNCGSCKKCVRTIFGLQALDLFERGMPFNREALTPREIARFDWRGVEYGEYLEEVVDYLTDTGRHPELLEAARIARSGKYYRGAAKLFRGNLGPRLRARMARRPS